MTNLLNTFSRFPNGLLACIVGLMIFRLAGYSSATIVLSSLPDILFQPPLHTGLHGLTALLACILLDGALTHTARMQSGLRPLAILLGGLGAGVTLEGIAYFQAAPAELLEQLYHFAMQNIIAAFIFSLAYVLARRLLLPGAQSAVETLVSPARTKPARSSLAIDLFAATNLLLFLAMTTLFYRDRFIHFRGLGHIGEFYAYAIAIFLAICLTWKIFRHASIPPLVLAGLQLGILMHFAGGLVFPEGTRLYDQHFVGIRFDKYVHLVNGCAAGLLVHWVWRQGAVRDGWLTNTSIVLAVLGLGGLVEIAEYAVYCTVPGNGVGGYHNNMQDLLSNLLGALAALFINSRRKPARRC
ncbi:hypothetical protein [Thauera propionica]|jgi:uncharacterized membrane protein YjdF|uniref:hypothetical protein n=1 Tax=Thauera propionica TaxID=2019431 RepID=UPI0023F182A8|nr:hypothetical protein [Thauera propionica]MDD3676836.1 hypothetical protein [Thauera propionica]